MILSLENLVQRIREFRDSRNWGQFHTPKDLAISISLESSELLEHFQWKEHTTIDDGVKSEVADIFIYLLYFCDATGIDLLESAGDKIALNERRYTVESSSGIAGAEGRIDVEKS